MADGDFDAAVSMFDETMKQALPASSLQYSVWNLIVGQAGAFIEVHDIVHSVADGYYICFITSRHESTGVMLRIVFSENGLLVSGLFIERYSAIAEDAA